MKVVVIFALLTGCSSPVLLPPPVAASSKYSGPSSLPSEHCAEDLPCWKRRTLLYVETSELLIAENKTLGQERDDAREGEIYARNIAAQLRKEAEPSWTTSPLLWLGVGVLGGIVLSIGAGLTWGSVSKSH